MNRGDVVEVNWPYSDLSGAKVRPAVVVRSDFLTGLIDDTILVKLARSRNYVGDMYTPQQLADMRAHPDRQRVLNAILDAHDALPKPTATSTEVMNRVRSGQLEVLLDAAAPAIGGLAPGENPVILGAQGILGNPHLALDQIHSVMLSTVHEGVHHIDVAIGRVLPGTSATVEQRFFTEMHAYTAEVELAQSNGLTHLLGSEFRGARHMNDIAAAVLTVESYLVPGLAKQTGLEQSVTGRVGAMFPTIPPGTP